MAMDWSGGGYGNYMSQPQEDIEDDEDFYGAGQDPAYNMNGKDHMHAAAGATAQDKVCRFHLTCESANLNVLHSNRTPHLQI